MRKPVNTVGRLDIAAARIADTLGQRFIPNEWPAFKPFIDQQCRKLKPGKPGSTTAILTEAVRLAGKYR